MGRRSRDRLEPYKSQEVVRYKPLARPTRRLFRVQQSVADWRRVWRCRSSPHGPALWLLLRFYLGRLEPPSLRVSESPSRQAHNATHPNASLAAMELPAADDEPQARALGRAAAKEIFRPLRWRRIGARPDEDAKLYERAGGSRQGQRGGYCLRAVRPLQGTLKEVEAVLTGATAALAQASGAARAPPSLLARLLPATLVSGGRAAAYRPLEHATGEREHVAVQFARLRPFRETTNTALAPADLDTHVLLAYTLTTRLQRSSAKKGDATPSPATAASVPSLLHLYRPVFCKELVRARGQAFERANLAKDDLSITYIVQEGAEAGALSLEVIVTCSQDPSASDVRRQQRQRLRHDALCLTRLQPFINAYRLEQERAVLRQQQRIHYQRQQHEDETAVRASTRSTRIFSRGSQQVSSNDARSAGQAEPQAQAPTASPTVCTICTRKFGAFRWKHYCEVCSLAICNHCTSVIANPAVARRKRRVCSRCLYGTTNGAHGLVPMQQQQQPAAAPAALTAATSAPVAPAPPRQVERPFPSLDNLIKPISEQRRNTTTAVNRNSAFVGRGPGVESSDSESDEGVQWRQQRQARGQSAPPEVANRTLRSQSGARRPPPPPPVPTLSGSNAAARRRSSVRQRPMSQQISQQRHSLFVTPGAAAGGRSIDDWHVRHGRHNSDAESSGSGDEGKYYSDNEVLLNPQQRIRARRAQTVTIDDDALPQPMLVRKKSFGGNVLTSAADIRATCSSIPDHRATVGGPASNKKLQFLQLKTPETDYELDYNWINIFPKAPVGVGDDGERERARYVESQLRIDAHSVVFLRDDSELEQLAHRVLDIATQWSGCSINYVATREVFCLVNASAEEADVIELAEDPSELTKTAFVIPDVMPREESASSFAVHHRAPFFIAELDNDARLRAHPLATDHGAVSFLSFPIYSSAVVNGSSGIQHHVIGTLDLWKLDRVAASSHVSNEWVDSMDSLLHAIGARMEDLIRESHSFVRPRQRKAISVGSSCDSRGSTRMADSFELDLFDIDSESVVESPPMTDAETLDRLSRLSYAKVRGAGANYSSMMGGVSGPPSSSWKYDDSDCESTTSSKSYRSDSSRQSSSSRYSTAAELHSTIESLLHQVSETSKIIRQTGVTV